MSGAASWARRLPAVLLLLGCAAGGFIAYRLTAPPRTTLHELPPPAASTPAPDPAPRAAAAGTATDAPASLPARKIPETLPPITLPGLDGTPHRLGEWNGRMRLINFWATWCEPCRREIPLLRALRREHAAGSLEVIGIAVDTPAAVQQYAHAEGIDYPLLVGEEGGLAAASAFGMDLVLPFSVFADSHGRIVTLKIGELHRDEAEFILERMRGIEAGSLDLATARVEIAASLRQKTPGPAP